MRDQWYANDRDVVKWSALVHLARRESIPTIVQVAMCRPDPPPAPLATALGKVECPSEVVRHFRNLEDIQRLAGATGLVIEVLLAPFRDRVRYFGGVVERIRRERAGALLVFLDPDIGVVSERPGPEHVSSSEVATLFEALRPGDLLVCYQHGRRQKDWRGKARRAFANAPGVPSFDVEVLASDLARDVLLLAARKGAAPATEGA